jgi:hypothetical protein
MLLFHFGQVDEAHKFQKICEFLFSRAYTVVMALKKIHGNLKKVLPMSDWMSMACLDKEVRLPDTALILRPS